MRCIFPVPYFHVHYCTERGLLADILLTLSLSRYCVMNCLFLVSGIYTEDISISGFVLICSFYQLIICICLGMTLVFKQCSQTRCYEIVIHHWPQFFLPLLTNWMNLSVWSTWNSLWRFDTQSILFVSLFPKSHVKKKVYLYSFKRLQWWAEGWICIQPFTPHYLLTCGTINTVTKVMWPTALHIYKKIIK